MVRHATSIKGPTKVSPQHEIHFLVPKSGMICFIVFGSAALHRLCTFLFPALAEFPTRRWCIANCSSPDKGLHAQDPRRHSCFGKPLASSPPASSMSTSQVEALRQMDSGSLSGVLFFARLEFSIDGVQSICSVPMYILG